MPLEVKSAFDDAQNHIFETNISAIDDEFIQKLEANINGWCRRNNNPFRPPLSVFGDAQIKEMKNQDRLNHKLQKAVAERAVYLESPAQQASLHYGLDFTLEQQQTITTWFGIQGIKIAFQQAFKKNNYNDPEHLYFSGALKDEIQKSNACIQTYFGKFDDRCKEMVSAMVPYLAEGDAFVTVSESHLSGLIMSLGNKEYRCETVNLTKRIHSISGPKQEGDIVNAYRTIYDALLAGQSSAAKRRGFYKHKDDVFDYAAVEEYTKNKDDQVRSVVAWKLAKEHYAKYKDPNNVELFEAIHKESLKHSSIFGIFKRTKNFADGEYTRDKIEDAPEDSRTGKIRRILYS